MMFIPITSTVSLFLCLCATKAEFQTLFSREEANPNTEDIYGLNSLKNSTLTYKICRNGENINVKKCKIFQENLDSENKQSKYCEITLNGEIDDENIGVVALGTNKAVVSWYDDAEKKEYFLRYTIVHFSDCKIAEARINFQRSEDRFLNQAYNVDVILRKDEYTFDVLFENSAVCGEKVCKITFDDQGNQISGPIPWFTALDDSFIYINPNSINGAYVASEIVPFAEKTRVSLLKPDGLKILKEVNHSHIDDATEYGLVRICYIPNQSGGLTCDLFDSAGELKSTISINLNYAIDVDVYNTHDEGFIVLISSKSNDSGFHFHLMKVDSSGKQLGPMEVPDFECKDATGEKQSYLFEKILGEYCVTRVCHSGQKYNVLSKCFIVDDLVVKSS